MILNLKDISESHFDLCIKTKPNRINKKMFIVISKLNLIRFLCFSFFLKQKRIILRKTLHKQKDCSTQKPKIRPLV
jgi:hypothetical protein